MNVIPSPLDRLLQLEERVEWLQSLQVQPPLSKDHEYLPLPSRHIWPVDELLLTRLLRRSPQVIGAYQAPAELTCTEKSGLLLTTSETQIHLPGFGQVKRSRVFLKFRGTTKVTII